LRQAEADDENKKVCEKQNRQTEHKTHRSMYVEEAEDRERQVGGR